MLLRGDKHQKNDHQKNDDRKRNALTVIQTRAAAPLVFTLGRGDHCLDTCRDRELTVSGTQAWGDHLFDDLLATRIRQRAFEAIANLNPDFAFVDKEKQNRAVVLALFPRLPCLEDPLREVDQLARLWQRLKNRHKHLRRGLTLVVLQALVESRKGRRPEPARLIVHIVRRRACGDLGKRSRRGKHQAEAGEPKAQNPPACMARQCHFASPD